MTYDLGFSLRIAMVIRASEDPDESLAQPTTLIGVVDVPTLTPDEVQEKIPQFEWRCEMKLWQSLFDQIVVLCWPDIQEIMELIQTRALEVWRQ